MAKANPNRQRNVRGDNRVAAIHVVSLVEKMHRAAEPARTAGLFSKKLRHACIRARAPGQARARDRDKQ